MSWFCTAQSFFGGAGWKAKVQACIRELLPSDTDKRCPVVVGELENVDGPLDMNPAAATPIAWGGFQSQDDDVVAVNGSEAEIVGADVCAVQVSASVTFINEGAAQNAQRAHPELWLLRNGVRVALAQTYIRDFAGHDSDTATISWWDLRPTGAVYSLEVQRDSIDTPASGAQATSALEVFRDPEIASYLQVAAFSTL